MNRFESMAILVAVADGGSLFQASHRSLRNQSLP